MEYVSSSLIFYYREKGYLMLCEDRSSHFKYEKIPTIHPPGGKRENNEDILFCAVREFKEELNFPISEDDIISSITGSFKKFDFSVSAPDVIKKKYHRFYLCDLSLLEDT